MVVHALRAARVAEWVSTAPQAGDGGRATLLDWYVQQHAMRPCDDVTLALWLASSCSPAEGVSDVAGGSRAPKKALLCNILESILVREFQKSCNFSSRNSGSASRGGGDEATTQVQSHNTPFRAEHPESTIVT